ncbi:MAG: hypothetical protein AB1722_12420 [Pseudomonadota bacterium]
MMIDHAPYFRAQAQQAKEQQAIDDMERRSAPLLWACYMAALVISLGAAADAAQAHLQRVGELAAQGEAFAQCLNGKAYKIDNVVVRCEQHEVKQLVAGLGDAR